MKCQIHASRDGQFYVRVVASNGETLAHSETYRAKADAVHCAELVAAGGSVEDCAG